MTGSRYEVWCHDCGSQMFRRQGRHGEFFGCSGYPICKSTMNLRDAAIRGEQDSSDRHDRDEEDMEIGMVVDE